LHYQAELDNNESAWKPILEKAEKSAVTLLYSAKGETQNNASVLRDYLVSKLASIERIKA
jgi:uncharacterized protein YeaO (DUF488 family)